MVVMAPYFMFCVVLSICSLIIGYSSVNAYSIDCSTTQCHNAFINCLPSEDCFISCSGAQECAGSVINCPVNGNCDIQCIGDQSCFDTTIDATLSAGSLTVNCGDGRTQDHSQFTNHCKTIKIFGSTLRQNPGDITVKCNGNCVDSDINCAFYGDCHILCDGSASCKHSQITGPIFGDLGIDCNAEGACIDATFNGAVSSKLSITGCHTYQSCLDLTIYCPPNTDGDRHCFIEGNDNLGIYRETISPTIAPTTQSPAVPTYNPTTHIGDGIAIYAINGWNDIAVNYTGTFGESHGGTMFCGDAYGVSCNVAANGWSCSNIHHECNSHTNHGIMDKPSTTFIYPTTTVSTTHRVSNEDENTDEDTRQPSESDLHSTDTSSNYSYISTKESEGDLFILICVGCVLLTCMGVGFAQIRKNMMEQQNANRADLYKQEVFRRHQSASFRRQRSISSKQRQSASLRLKPQSFRDKQPKEIASDYDSILL